MLDLSRNKIGTELGERDTDGRRMEVGEAVGAALGEMIEDQGYFDVFILTTFIGLAAVVLVCLEWWRQKRAGRNSGVVTPDITAQPAE